MSEETGRTIRISVSPAILGNKIRTVVISREKGIKALYDVTDKRIISYLFDKGKGGTLETAVEWLEAFRARFKGYKELTVDQEEDFVKLCVEYNDGESEQFEPSYGHAFVVDNGFIKEQEAEMQSEDKVTKKIPVFCPNCGWNGNGKSGDECPDCQSKVKDKPSKDRDRGDDKKGKVKKPHTGSCKDCGHKLEADKMPEKRSPCPKCGGFVIYKMVTDEGHEVEFKYEGDPVDEEKSFQVDDTLDIIKADKAKQIVYGVFLWPDKADHDGDIISPEDIESVAHKFLVEYRAIDEMHKKETIEAEIVESFIAWMDNLEYYGKMLKRGAWAGAIHVSDKKVWDKIEEGQYKGFSVRISGRREPVGNGIEEVING